tara:strand:- start:918 stop:1055 length:138 start_codon:yes stop_codon:yes gene_type:complete
MHILTYNKKTVTRSMVFGETLDSFGGDFTRPKRSGSDQRDAENKL